MALPLRTSEIPPLISIVIIVIVADSTAVAARELRPSDHGLDYYYASGRSPEMMSFFGSSSLSPSAGTTLPSAVKSPPLIDTWRTKGTGVHRDDHVISHALIVASLVCGCSGVALLVASALIYFLGRRNKKTSSSSCNNPNGYDPTNNTK